MLRRGVLNLATSDILPFLKRIRLSNAIRKGMKQWKIVLAAVYFLLLVFAMLSLGHRSVSYNRSEHQLIAAELRQEDNALENHVTYGVSNNSTGKEFVRDEMRRFEELPLLATQAKRDDNQRKELKQKKQSRKKCRCPTKNSNRTISEYCTPPPHAKKELSLPDPTRLDISKILDENDVDNSLLETLRHRLCDVSANTSTPEKPEAKVIVIGDEVLDFLHGMVRRGNCIVQAKVHRGLTVADARRRLRDVVAEGSNPDKIIIHAGSRDIAADRPSTSATVSQKLKDLVDEIQTVRRRSMLTAFAISGMLPRNDPVMTYNHVINIINSNVGWYAQRHGVEFIDHSHIFWENGSLNTSLFFVDGSLTEDGRKKVEDSLFEGRLCQGASEYKDGWMVKSNHSIRRGNRPSLELKDILPTERKNYDKHVPPKKNGQPTTVYFHVTVLSVDSIDEESMMTLWSRTFPKTYVADIFLAQSWQDYRLRLPENMTEGYRILDVGWLKYIWRPDSFFKNAKKVTFHEMSVPNHYLWLYYDKTLLYMAKLTLELSCAMKFEAYPHDTQNCSMMIESLSHTTDDLVFLWNITSPLVVSEGVELPQLDIVESSTEDCTLTYSTGNFTCIAVIFHLKRRLGYHLFHTYIPTTLIVVMSWISFWIRPEAIPARVTLGVTSLLTLATQNTQSQSSLPPVSYVKAIDVWMSSCTVFVFMSLMEFAVVNHYMGYTSTNKVMRGYSVDELDKLMRRTNGVRRRSDSFSSPRDPSICCEMDIALAIDKFSRFFFPFSFLVLNLAYWCTYAVP